MPRQTNTVKKSKKSATSEEAAETSDVQDTTLLVEPTDTRACHVTDSDQQVEDEDETTDDVVADSNSARVDQIVEMAKDA